MEEIDYSLLAKYLSGETSDNEEEKIKHWVNESEENKKIFKQYQYFYQQTEISEEVNTSSFQKRSNRKSIPWKYISAIAASILLLFTLTYYFSQLDNLSNQEASLVESTSIIKSNPKGQKSMIMLPDGSRIWLNAESTIKYEENFSDSLRVVQLTGEAFFDVVKDPLRPFIVEANDLKTTVIGTSFNVYSYPESQGATVSLLSGKLKLTSTKENTFLEPGEQANHNQENGTLTKQKIDIETIALWKDNILVFEKEEFETVIHRLERWYGVDIVIQGQPAKQWKFTGYFENENLKNVLEVLSFGKNINFKIEGKHVRLMMN